MHSKHIGKDVLTENVLMYMSWKPFDGGMDLTHIVICDPKGTIPGFVKSATANRMASML